MSIKISEMTAAGTLTGSEVVPILQSGTNKKTTTQAIADLGGLGYLVYTALITQSLTDTPVVTVLKNTLGFNIYWRRDDVGTYVTRANSMSDPLPAGSFPSGKTWQIISQVSSFIGEPSGASIQWDTDDQIEIQSGWNGTRADNVLFRNCIEIRVYP